MPQALRWKGKDGHENHDDDHHGNMCAWISLSGIIYDFQQHSEDEGSPRIRESFVLR